jgi:hypothetical protein
MSNRRYATDGGEPNDDYPTVRNEERGCGFLEHGKAYLRSPPASAAGHLPAFVEFSPPVPYLERDKFRGYEFFPGIQFELSVTGGLGVYEGARYDVDPTSPPELRSPDEVREDAPEGVPSFDGLTTTDPVGEVHRHVKRLSLTEAGGNHAGEVPAFKSHDLYQHIGASYYETPEEFIDEVRRQGLSKAIPASESHEPPRVNPGRTRLFLVHPNATAENEPGVIGYVYLHRTIYTETKSGEIPAWVQEEAAGREDFEPVHIGDRIHSDGKRETQIGDEWELMDEKDADDLREEEESEAEAAKRNLPRSVRPSDKPGRDVEEVPPGEDPPEPLGEEDENDAVDDEETVEDDEEPAEDSQDTDDDEPDETPETDEETDETDDGPNTDPFDRAEVVEVPRPEECPECGTPVSIGSMRTEDYGDVEVRVCREGCESWDNSSEVNAALCELDLREDHDYNSLRSEASSRGLNLGGTPSKDDLVYALLDDMGALP